MSYLELQETLNERQESYGGFECNSSLAQSLKQIIRSKSYKLSAHHQESLEMIAHKIARILCGDQNNTDSWLDIAGYAQLTHDIIIKKKEQDNEDLN